MKKSTNIRFKIIYIFIYIILIIINILSILYIIEFLSLKKEAQEQSNLLNNYKNENIDNYQKQNINSNETNEIVNESKEQIAETERMTQLKEIQEINSDIVGWLEIPNTNINYPVLQGSDNEYYMTHNYKKEYSKNGSIFLAKDYDWTIPSSNLLIYGHNLGNGEMFQELLKYENQDYYNQHPIIRFTTTKEDAEYEIISVFKSRVYYKSEQNVFRYYYFINANTEDEYNQFINNAKQASLYNIEASAKYGDQLITLSTCSYHVEDGRFAVIGRKIK